MGTGHSGSRHLAEVLPGLGFYVVHEMNRMFRGGGDISTCDWEGAGDFLVKDPANALVGFPYGLMVHYLRYRIPDLPVICVHRKLEAWLKATGGNDNITGAMSYPRNLRDKTHYWELYEHLMLSVAPPVLHMEMEDLNDAKALIKAFLAEAP